MLILFETSAGYALFKATKPGKFTSAANVAEEFSKASDPGSLIKFKAFAPFENTTDAVVAATSIIDSNMDKSLKKFLKKNIVEKDPSEELAVADSKLGGVIRDSLSIKCVHNDMVMEVFRSIRQNLDLLMEKSDGDMKAMQLGLSHSLSRYKLKFSADKVDIMIVQAIGLLDDLDKEINIYAMRVREWYGWHFPEMAKIINDNMFYAKCVLRMGLRVNCKNCDFSDILGDESLEETFKKAAETSMGTEISETDLMNIKSLCEQVVNLSDYRLQLFEYLKNRMAAIAPNLTMMVGELVGARLIAHSGSLLNLAKHPASTIQILGAEKALFRALKTKTDTPKYGLIYHASLIGQAGPKIKGKVSRVLAAKTALAIRVDALGETEGPTIGIESRQKVEARIRQLEGGQRVTSAGPGPKAATGASKYDAGAAKATSAPKYSDANDVVVASSEKEEKKDKKRNREEDDEAAGEKKKKKKDKDESDKKKKKDKK